MTLDTIQSICKSLPGVTEDIKWENDLCFCIAKKMFCVATLTTPLMVSFKVKDEEFDELSRSDGVIPAPYAARHKWVLVQDVNRFNKKEWKHYITQSYELIAMKLPKKFQAKIGFLSK